MASEGEVEDAALHLRKVKFDESARSEVAASEREDESGEGKNINREDSGDTEDGSSTWRTSYDSRDEDGMSGRSSSVSDITMYNRDDDGDHEFSLDEDEDDETVPLPDAEYQVVKINQRGRRQNRVLKLDSSGISNIRSKDVVTKHHPYRDVTRVGLDTIDTFTISYSNDHDFKYVSPVAMQIVQEITSRLAFRHHTEKKKIANDIALKFQEKLKKEGAPVQRVRQLSSATRSASPSRRTSLQPRGQSRKANKLLQITGDTEEQRVTVAVDKVVFDRSSPEGRTIAHFVQNFATLEKHPQTAASNVRQFIDGMRNYITEHRGEELETLIVDDDPSASLNNVIENSLERAIVQPLQSRLMKCVATTINQEDNETLKEKMVQARDKEQTFFGMPEEHVSPTNWTSSITELRYVNHCELPQDKLQALLDSAKGVYSTYNDDRNEELEEGEEPKHHILSADDFLPIHLYVTVQAEIKDPLLLVEYMWAMCDPLQLNGEGGYYLTVFQSALMYLQNLREDGQCVIPEDSTI